MYLGINKYSVLTRTERTKGQALKCISIIMICEIILRNCEKDFLKKWRVHCSCSHAQKLYTSASVSAVSSNKNGNSSYFISSTFSYTNDLTIWIAQHMPYRLQWLITAGSLSCTVALALTNALVGLPYFRFFWSDINKEIILSF